MKTKALLLSASLAVAGVSSAHAQIPRPVANGTVLGAIAGAFIGGHNNDRWGEGALIGATAGALIGAVVDQAQTTRPTVYQRPYNPPVTVVRSAPAEVCVQPGTQVIYVQPQPRVVYVQRPEPPRVVYVPAPPPAPRVVIVEDPRHRRPAPQVVYVSPSRPRW